MERVAILERALAKSRICQIFQVKTKREKGKSISEAKFTFMTLSRRILSSARTLAIIMLMI